LHGYEVSDDRYRWSEAAMILEYVTAKMDGTPTKPYWYAHNLDNDGTGPTPLDAVCAMVNQIEAEKS
jgi:hypothetical protein